MAKKRGGDDKTPKKGQKRSKMAKGGQRGGKMYRYSHPIITKKMSRRTKKEGWGGDGTDGQNNVGPKSHDISPVQPELAPSAASQSKTSIEKTKQNKAQGRGRCASGQLVRQNGPCGHKAGGREGGGAARRPAGAEEFQGTKHSPARGGGGARRKRSGWGKNNCRCIAWRWNHEVSHFLKTSRPIPTLGGRGRYTLATRAKMDQNQ